MANGQWYYCLLHGAVEPYDACRAADRLGPYPTADDASHALEIAQERNERWETDPRFNDPPEDSVDAESDASGAGVGDGAGDVEGWGPFQR